MFNENICSRHQPAISASQSIIHRKVFHKVSHLPEGELCAASGWQAESSLYHSACEIKAGKRNCQVAGSRRCSENSPTRLNELLLEVETSPDRMPRDSMQEAVRRSPEAPLTLYLTFKILNSQGEEEEEEPQNASAFTARLGKNFPATNQLHPDPFYTIRHIIVDLWDMLRGYFERLKFGDESKDLATTVVERCLKREADLLPLAEKQVRAFAWTVAHNVCHEAWKRAKRWQALFGSHHKEGKAEEGVGIEHHQYAGQDTLDPENLLGEEEERADERRCWDEVQKRLPKSDLETLLSYIERENAIERGERRPALLPRERVRIFRAIGRARLLGQEVRRERSCSRAQLDARANHARAPRAAPKRPLRGPRKRT